MIEQETMQNLREDMTPVSVPPVPPTPKSDKQFAGKSARFMETYEQN